MSTIVRLLALLAFVVAVALCVIDDTPDFIDVLTALGVGLALWVGSTLVPER